MDQKLRNFYLEAQVRNAPPGQLLIMLYDGLIDHAERADAAMSPTEHPIDPSAASRAVSCCINIMTELNSSLRPSVDPVLCATLRHLYLFFTKEFSEAFDKREPKRIRAILPLIRDLRNAWSEAYRRAGQAQALVA
jgi:flagellar protein FliS